jgi:hypothetical protein
MTKKGVPSGWSLLSRARTWGTGTREGEEDDDSDDDDGAELGEFSPKPRNSAASLSTACAEGSVTPGGFLRSTARQEGPA